MPTVRPRQFYSSSRQEDLLKSLKSSFTPIEDGQELKSKRINLKEEDESHQNHLNADFKTNERKRD